MRRCAGRPRPREGGSEALRYGPARRGLEAGGVPLAARRLRALEEVEGTPGAAEAWVAEVALPDALRERMPNRRGFVMGELQILFERMEGPPHAHLSVSHPSRYPTWPELLRARGAPGRPSPNLWASVPKEGDAAAHGAGGRTVHLYVAPPRELMG